MQPFTHLNTVSNITLAAIAAACLLLSACAPTTGSTLEECEAFCTPKTVTTLDACFADDEGPIDDEACTDVCMDEGFGSDSINTCVTRAGEDCDAVAACLGTAENDFPTTFEVNGDKAIMNGVIDARTITAVQTLIADHPEVVQIVLLDCPGSMDDTSNLQASRLIREAGLATHVPANGTIASGAVDLFLAGTKRTADLAGGARLGVHSWGGDDIQGSDVPREDAAHTLHLDYYTEMGIPTEFYWFTLEAAPAADIHWMTTDEVARYMLLTE